MRGLRIFETVHNWGHITLVALVSNHRQFSNCLSCISKPFSSDKVCRAHRQVSIGHSSISKCSCPAHVSLRMSGSRCQQRASFPDGICSRTVQTPETRRLSEPAAIDGVRVPQSKLFSTLPGLDGPIQHLRLCFVQHDKHYKNVREPLPCRTIFPSSNLSSTSDIQA